MLRPFTIKTFSPLLAGMLVISFSAVLFPQQKRVTKVTPAKTQTKQEAVRQKNKSAQQTKPITDWYKFTAPDKDFTLMTPVLMQRGQGGQGDLTEIREYIADTSDTHFSVNFQDLDIPESDPLFNRSCADNNPIMVKLLKQKGWRIISMRQTTKNISEMEAWMPTAKPNLYLHFFSRHIIYNGRLYALGCSSRFFNQEVNRNLCNQYFESFEYLDGRKPE